MKTSLKYLPALILLCGCLFVWNARSQSAIQLVAPLTTVMASLPGYRVTDQQLSAEEQRIAGMSDYVARVYWRDSLPMFSTFVSYYERQTQGKTIHSPRNCLPGAGWQVMSAGREDVIIDGKVQTLNRYLIKNGAASAVVFYWYQGRGRIVANEYRVKWNLLRDAAIAGHSEEALVRVVVPIHPSRASAESATERQRVAEASSLGLAISAQLTREVGRVLPRA